MRSGKSGAAARRGGVGAGAGVVLILSLAAPVGAQEAAQAGRTLEGALDSGATWTAAIPEDWNGALLLWSHGYSPVQGPAEAAPRGAAEALLELDYALAGSSYSAGGWAVEEAVPDQIATLDAFEAAAGRAPDRVLAWGASMGGLVTVALAEKHADRVDGALPLCGSIGGAPGMMNMALDGAFALKTLTDADFQLVGIEDDRANGAVAREAVARLRETPEGLARIALAGVLAGLPRWTGGDAPPAQGDAAAEARQMADVFAMAAVPPRQDQEARAGGVNSWNTGVDYVALLERSGRRALVETLYEEAGLDLDADLERLNAAPRIAAEADAAGYMIENYAPHARPTIPVLALQKTGDGITTPALQRAWVDAAQANAGPEMAQAIWVDGAGHCDFEAEALTAAVTMLDGRVMSGAWPAAPANLFTPHEAPAMPRVCFQDGECEGRP